MHVQKEFLISSATSDPEVHWPAEHMRLPQQGIEAIAPNRRAARGQQRSSHEIT
jgi:hypothetical protein